MKSTFHVVHSVAQDVNHFMLQILIHFSTCFVFIYLASGCLITMEEGSAPYLRNKISFFSYLQSLAYQRDKKFPLSKKCQELSGTPSLPYTFDVPCQEY